MYWYFPWHSAIYVELKALFGIKLNTLRIQIIQAFYILHEIHIIALQNHANTLIRRLHFITEYEKHTDSQTFIKNDGMV